MASDLGTPIIRWIVAAVCLHSAMGRGGEVVSERQTGKDALWTLVVRGEGVVARGRDAELVVDPAPPEPSEPPAPLQHKDPDRPKPAPEPTLPAVKLASIEPLKTAAPVPPPVPTPEPEKRTPLVVVPTAAPPPPPPPPPTSDRRIAIRQHVTPSKEDPKDARYLAEQSAKVDKEEVARQTSLDRDDKVATPNKKRASTDPSPGDSDQTRIAESEKRKGERDAPPGDRPLEAIFIAVPIAASRPATGGDGRPKMAGEPPASPSPAAAPGAGAALPSVGAKGELLHSHHGHFGIGAGRPAPQSSGGANPAPPGSATGVRHATLGGLGLSPPSPGGGLGPSGIGGSGLSRSVFGSQLFDKLKEGDGERRISEHRGGWKGDAGQYRSAIENYVPGVKPGNQTALNAAQAPFAAYIHAMHLRIHPIFADLFLRALDKLPKDHKLNDMSIMGMLEIVLTRDGRVARLGLVRSSGFSEFDLASLHSVTRAGPFGTAPSAIVSHDGLVHLHWEFHRNGDMCSTAGARPYILPEAKPAPSAPAPKEPPPAPKKPIEPGQK